MKPAICSLLTELVGNALVVTMSLGQTAAKDVTFTVLVEELDGLAEELDGLADGVELNDPQPTKVNARAVAAVAVAMVPATILLDGVMTCYPHSGGSYGTCTYGELYLVRGLDLVSEPVCCGALIFELATDIFGELLPTLAFDEPKCEIQAASDAAAGN